MLPAMGNLGEKTVLDKVFTFKEGVDSDYLTTISIWANSTKKDLDSFKLIEDESYDHIINRLIRKVRKAGKK